MTIAPPDSQLSLLSVAPSFRIVKNAQARNAYGAVAAEIVCAALGLTPIPINGNYEACFDAAKCNHFYEIKSCKRNGKVVLYDWRMRKEQKANVDLTYAILCHRVKGSDGLRLFDEMIDEGLELIVMPAAKVHALALEQSLVIPKAPKTPQAKRFGYNRAGYCEGYRNVPVALLKSMCASSKAYRKQCHGRAFEITIHTSF